MKKKLIQQIAEFFKNHVIEGYIDLILLKRNFESTDTNGSIEIIWLTENDFTYRPSGHLDEIDGEYKDLSISDLKEILSILEDYKTDLDKTF